eukprot:jgi/Botrbrau1/4060/Bobra.152_3s0016.1
MKVFKLSENISATLSEGADAGSRALGRDEVPYLVTTPSSSVDHMNRLNQLCFKFW